MQSESVIVPHFKKLLLPILKMIDQDSGSLRIIRNNVASSFDISVKQQSIAVPTASKNSFHINFDIALRWLTKVGFIEQNSRPKPEHPNKKEGILTITALGIQAVQTGEVGEIPSSLEDRDLANEVAKRYLQSSPGQKASKIDTSRILRRSKTLLAERKIIAGLPDASLEKLMELWRTNISRIGDHAQRDKHLACKAIVSAIELEWRKRLDIHERNPGEFVWPSTVALTGDGGLEIDQSPDLGMLAFLGYHVGRTNGLNVGLRRVILDCVYLGTLPPIEGPAYYKGWGEPESAKRLQKLADSIASFTRNAKRRGRGRMSDAISDWEADLDYLHRTYFLPRFNFGWPKS